MRSPAHDTALYLADLPDFGSFGGSTGWPLYVGREPIDPVDVVTVYDTGGGPAVLIPDLRAPNVQVRVRSAAYNDGWQKANEAYEALAVPAGVTVQDGVILSWVAQGDINYIGRDDRDRSLFTCNWQVMRDGVAS